MKMRPQRNIAYPYFFLRQADRQGTTAMRTLHMVPLADHEAAEIASLNAYMSMGPGDRTTHKKNRDRIVEKAAEKRRIHQVQYLGSASTGTIWRKEGDQHVQIQLNEEMQLIQRHRIK